LVVVMYFEVGKFVYCVVEVHAPVVVCFMVVQPVLVVVVPCFSIFVGVVGIISTCF
jgi:hypothetical protein